MSTRIAQRFEYVDGELTPRDLGDYFITYDLLQAGYVPLHTFGRGSGITISTMYNYNTMELCLLHRVNNAAFVVDLANWAEYMLFYSQLPVDMLEAVELGPEASLQLEDVPF